MRWIKCPKPKKSWLLYEILAKAVARKWSDVLSNAVNPGWVPTKMGGSGASDDLQKGAETQVWLATSEDARISGRYFFHQKEARYLKKADEVILLATAITSSALY